jgi:hypothetical protein
LSPTELLDDLFPEGVAMVADLDNRRLGDLEPALPGPGDTPLLSVETVPLDFDDEPFDALVIHGPLQGADWRAREGAVVEDAKA